MDKMHQFTVKDLDNSIQFLRLIKTKQQPQKWLRRYWKYVIRRFIKNQDLGAYRRETLLG
jgi:hypothetical protein